MKLWKQSLLAFHTVVHLERRQIWFRIRSLLLRRVRELGGFRPDCPTDWVENQRAGFFQSESFSGSSTLFPGLEVAINRAEAISLGRFSFLNLEMHWPEGPDWNPPHVPQLWRFNLHYFTYFDDLLIWALCGHSRESYELFQELVISWNQGNARLSGDGWHPYTVSLRIVNWLNGSAIFRERIAEDSDFRQELLTSIYGQARFLSKNLEFDVRGNHLIKNLKGLAWAGVFFEGEEPDSWLNHSCNYLQAELQEQVHDDGGHFERNPGYHVEVLKDLIDIGVLLRENGIDQGWGFLNPKIESMIRFLMEILPPNDRLPLIKDTTYGSGLPAHQVLAYGSQYLRRSSWKVPDSPHAYLCLIFGTGKKAFVQDVSTVKTPVASKALPESGFQIWRDDNLGDFLIADFGQPCPDFLPAHAHADLFSYELTIGGSPIVVDSGVYEYKQGLWRDHFRSTRAHNTIVINGLDQSEVWSSFRVGQRAQPKEVMWKIGTKYCLLSGVHDGYGRLGFQVSHRRWIFWIRKRRQWLFLDWICSSKSVNIESLVHLYPSVEVSLEQPDEVRLRTDNVGLNMRTCALSLGQNVSTKLDLKWGQMNPQPQGWYSEQFGKMEPNPVVVLSGRDCRELLLGYSLVVGSATALRLGREEERVVLESEGSCRLEFSHRKLLRVTCE